MGRLDFEVELYGLAERAREAGIDADRIQDIFSDAMDDLSKRGRLRVLRDAGLRGVTWPPESDFDLDEWLYDLMKLAAAQGETKDYMMDQLEEELVDVRLPRLIERAYAEAQAKRRAGR